MDWEEGGGARGWIGKKEAGHVDGLGRRRRGMWMDWEEGGGACGWIGKKEAGHVDGLEEDRQLRMAEGEE